LHDYAVACIVIRVITFRPISGTPSLPPASGHARR
jgi:hypothetical protein